MYIWFPTVSAEEDSADSRVPQICDLAASSGPRFGAFSPGSFRSITAGRRLSAHPCFTGIIPMKIVILDDVTITPAQEERLRRHGEVVIFTGVPTRPEEILSRAEGAQILIASWTKINAQILESLPHLK